MRRSPVDTSIKSFQNRREKLKGSSPAIGGVDPLFLLNPNTPETGTDEA